MSAVFGERLRDLRFKAGYSVAALARHLGYSTPYVSDVERGHRLPFDEKTIRKAASFLNVDPEPLLRAAEEARGTIRFDIERYPDVAIDLLSSLARSGRSEETYQALFDTLKKRDEQMKNKKKDEQMKNKKKEP
jgi:transcriptional regulator with XRE-family HTH domain